MLLVSLNSLLLVVEIALIPSLLYLLVLSLAALVQRPGRHANANAPATHFALLVPAHDEEAVLGALFASLGELTYPTDLYTVHLVADNCSDTTADIAREAGAHVYERQDSSKPGKGYALRWLLAEMERAGYDYAAYVFLDADTVISPNFLAVMDAQLQAGEQVIQCLYRVQNSQDAWTSGLRALAFTLFNHLRPLGRKTLGWSCGLKGTGMCFSRAVMRQFGWSAYSLTEDIEHHLELINAGLRVAYAPEATLLSAMPTSLKQARSQEIRWERGRLQLVRQYVPRLLGAALRQRSGILFDAAMEILTPPLSALAGLIICCLVGAVLLRFIVGIGLALGLVAALMIYVLVGLKLAKLSRAAYRSLLFAPIYVPWKFCLYLVALFSPGQRRWVRTQR